MTLQSSECFFFPPWALYYCERFSEPCCSVCVCVCVCVSQPASQRQMWESGPGGERSLPCGTFLCFPFFFSLLSERGFLILSLSLSLSLSPSPLPSLTHSLSLYYLSLYPTMLLSTL